MISLGMFAEAHKEATSCFVMTNGHKFLAINRASAVCLRANFQAALAFPTVEAVDSFLRYCENHETQSTANLVILEMEL